MHVYLDLALLVLFASSQCIRSVTQSTNYTFVSYPHTKMFRGELLSGQWLVGDAAEKYFHLPTYDRIQRAAIDEGVFIPNGHHHASGSRSWYLFSSMDARKCLFNKRLDFAGDSYMKQFLIGLTDILLSSPSNVEIYGRETRTEIMNDRLDTVKMSSDPSIKAVKLMWRYASCEHEDMQCFVDNVKETPPQASVFVMNSFIHQRRTDSYLGQVSALFGIKAAHLIWATAPYYGDNALDTRNNGTKALALSKNVPALDFLTLTATCPWTRCVADGSHRARFVNRMKAQMLLNLVCGPNSARP